MGLTLNPCIAPQVLSELPTHLVELTLASLKGAGRLDRYLALLPDSMHASAMVAQLPCIRSHNRLVISGTGERGRFPGAPGRQAPSVLKMGIAAASFTHLSHLQLSDLKVPHLRFRCSNLNSKSDPLQC